MFFSPCAWVSCYDDIWGSESKVSRIFKLAPDRGEWSASHPDCFTTDESVLGAYWIGGLVGHRTDFIVTAKRKIPRLFGNWTCSENSLTKKYIEIIVTWNPMCLPLTVM
jgi:hypothetical protein